MLDNSQLCFCFLTSWLTVAFQRWGICVVSLNGRRAIVPVSSRIWITARRRVWYEALAFVLMVPVSALGHWQQGYLYIWVYIKNCRAMERWEGIDPLRIYRRLLRREESPIRMSADFPTRLRCRVLTLSHQPIGKLAASSGFSFRKLGEVRERAGICPPEGSQFLNKSSRCFQTFHDLSFSQSQGPNS